MKSNFWADYPNIQGAWGSLGAKKGFMENVSQLGGFIYEILKILWMVAFFISIIAFVMSVASMVLHSDDNPIMKDHAKHDLFAALASIAVLSSIGLIYSIIVSFIF